MSGDVLSIESRPELEDKPTIPWKISTTGRNRYSHLWEVLPRNSTCLILYPLLCWRGRVWLADSFNMQIPDSLSMNKQETPRIEPSVRKLKGVNFGFCQLVIPRFLRNHRI